MVDAVGRQNLGPDDVLLTTLPYLQGAHTTDCVIAEPVFAHDELIGFSALRAHIGDLGGMSFLTLESTEIFQEGLLLPPVRLVEAGRVNEMLLDIIRTNSRLPVETTGHCLAGVAALRAASTVVRDLINKYGLDIYRSAIDELLNHGERVARAGVARIPDGVYRAEGALDDNGVLRTQPVPLKVTVTIAGSDMIIDTTGSAAQQGGPVNCPLPLTKAACQMVLKILAAPNTPANGGEARVLTVIAPEGSIFNSGPHAAVNSAPITTVYLAELIIGALGRALPDDIPAVGGGLVTVVTFLSVPTTSGWIYNLSIAGAGFGAKRGSDGMTALFPYQAAGLRAVSTEVMEARTPLFRHRYELDQDSCGAGQWRGGLGVVFEEEYLAQGFAAMSAERTSGVWPIVGHAEGLPPKRSDGTVFYAGTDREIGPPNCKRSNLPIVPGDRSIAWTAGGAGFGNPLDREPERVALDIKNEYVSREAGYHYYGVVVTGDAELDMRATQTRRTQLLAERRRDE
jgi:N-methylhydantoinase B